MPFWLEVMLNMGTPSRNPSCYYSFLCGSLVT